MTTHPTLTQILDDLIHGRLADAKLSGGLGLQFKAADDDHPESRLCAIRIGVPVGTVELGTLRRELEALLPGVVIGLDDEQTITGQDGRKRHYRVFRWRPKEEAVQMELLHVEQPVSAMRRRNGGFGNGGAGRCDHRPDETHQALRRGMSPGARRIHVGSRADGHGHSEKIRRG